MQIGPVTTAKQSEVETTTGTGTSGHHLSTLEPLLILFAPASRRRPEPPESQTAPVLQASFFLPSYPQVSSIPAFDSTTTRHLFSLPPIVSPPPTATELSLDSLSRIQSQLPAHCLFVRRALSISQLLGLRRRPLEVSGATSLKPKVSEATPVSTRCVLQLARFSPLVAICPHTLSLCYAIHGASYCGCALCSTVSLVPILSARRSTCYLTKPPPSSPTPSHKRKGENNQPALHSVLYAST